MSSPMTNKQALREAAESTIGILENIAGFEPSDIDGDTVELRFETDGGLDTGCDVSIVYQCQKAADVVRALLDEMDNREKLRAAANRVVNQQDIELQELRQRVAELEAREVRITLPHELTAEDCDVLARPLDYGTGWNLAISACEEVFIHAMKSSGIRINGEG